MEGDALRQFHIRRSLPFRFVTPTMAAVQRPLKGSRISTFYPVKNLPALSTLDSAFQLQEFISLTIRSNIHDVSAIVSIPESRSNPEGGSDESASVFTDEPDGDRDTRNEFAVDEACWIYEQLRYAVSHASTYLIGTHRISSRRLAQDLSHPLITMLQQECTRASCPEMKAGEWMYLCVAHGNDGAMEVSFVFCTGERSSSLTVAAAMLCHRLHSAHGGQRNGASQLTASVPITVRHTNISLPFWPVLTLTSLHRINIPPPSHRHFGSLARRLGRIFAHAYFHHREVFEQAEAESSLYARFLALTCKFDLVPQEFLIIPTSSGMSDDPEPPRLLAAAVDPQHHSGSDDENDDRGRGTHRGLGMDILGGIDRNPSPRKGRNRTGTMIFSEALIMAEELTKGGSPERESVVQIPPASTEMPESESDFVHVDVSSREEGEGEEEHHEEEEHESPLGSPTEEEVEKSDFGLDSLADSLAEKPEDYVDYSATLSEMHTHVESFEDHQAPEEDEQDEQDVTDDAEDAEEEDADEAPEHDVTSAHETSGTTIIELSPADSEDIDESLEEDAQEEDLTEAVVEPHDEDDDVADAQEVDEQISLDEPHDQPAET